VIDSREESSCYAVRRLNPFRGVVQVVRTAETRAISLDGSHWEIQIQAQKPDDLWGGVSPGNTAIQFLRFGTWSPNDGLRRVPAHPLLDLTSMFHQAEILIALLEESQQDLPFLLRDRFELWLLDGTNRMPLALLASAIELDKQPQRPAIGRWHCADRSSKDFSSPHTDETHPPHPKDTDPHPHMSALERLIQTESGHTLAQWFERDSSGGGRGLPLAGNESLNDRQLPAGAFPELLLRQVWQAEWDSTLVDDYLNWLAPYLLTLQEISDQTRGKLEQHARGRAMLINDNWTLYPKIIDRAAIDAARVEVRIRQSC